MDNSVIIKERINEGVLSLALEVLKEKDLYGEKVINYSLSLIENNPELRIEGRLFDVFTLVDLVENFVLLMQGELSESICFRSIDKQAEFYLITNDTELYVELRIYSSSRSLGRKIILEETTVRNLIYFFKFFLVSRSLNRIFYTKSNRPITYYIENEDKVNIREYNLLFEALLNSWEKGTSYPSCQKDINFDIEYDPTYGQCAVTAMIVRDYLGGKVYKIKNDNGSTHYFNVVNDVILDMTSDQFSLYDMEIDYSNMYEVDLNYLGKSEDTKKRYKKLKDNVEKYLENIEKGEHYGSKCL